MFKHSILGLIIFCAAGGAAVWEVHEGEAIQSAVLQSSNGDTVLIHDGLYTESVVLYGKTITLGSMMLLDGDTTHVLETMIRPDTLRPDTQSCLVYAYGERVGGRLMGLTLANGRGTQYGSEFEDFLLGGGVYADSSSVSIEWCRFENCEAKHGGGLSAFGWSTQEFDSTRIDVRHCLFFDCEGTFLNGWSVSGGGAIHAWDCTLNLSQTTFEADTVSGYGGALDCYGNANVDSCAVRHCYAMIGGGFHYGSHGRIADCLFEDNTDSEGFAGHLDMGGAFVTVTRNVFRSCVGEGIAVLTSGLGATFAGNVTEDNVSNRMWGVFMVNGTSNAGHIAYNIFRRNHTSGGGTLTFNDAVAAVHHNVFEECTVDSVGHGSAIFSMYYGWPTVDSNVFRNNKAPSMSVWDHRVTIDAMNNYWGHPSGPYHPELNPAGQGDTLFGTDVLFVPWLTEPPDTTPPQGFDREQPTVVPNTWELMDTYPNPFNQSVTLVLAGFTGGDFEIGLYNLLGQQVDVIHRGALTGGQVHYQAPPWLASGVYLLSARDKHGIQTKKVVLLK